ncbi:MAG TPA: hypothetical protein VK666_25400, partial [Chryseolinea sp.]|nr:hypothetical protein [Chryseolinea sp.]
TIYILIPLLVIPQLLLSGVVISFDKFNPTVGKPIGVPLIGEVMASRWAFEAFMVTQFKDNPFQKQFYPLDQVVREAEYKKRYFIPGLETKLAYCLNHRSEWQNPNSEKMVNAVTMLQNGIKNELKSFNKDVFPEVDRLAIGHLDSTVLKKTAVFLGTLKQYYVKRMDKFNDRREEAISILTNTPTKAAQYEEQKTRFVNQAVTEAVENISSPQRIIEYDGNFIQKIYPIYSEDHHPVTKLDFSANFYQPTKHFAGFYFNTLYFNLTVIWCMTIIFFLTLYFDLLKRLIKRLEGSRKYKVKDK